MRLRKPATGMFHYAIKESDLEAYLAARRHDEPFTRPEEKIELTFKLRKPEGATSGFQNYRERK